MPLNYSIALLSNPKDKLQPKKAYAKAQVGQEVTLKDLSRRIASQTTVSRADVTAVLISMVENTIDILRSGDQADFGELGKFRLQITSTGAAKAEEFTSNNITGVNIQFAPGEDMKNLFAGMSFTPVPSRYAVRAVLKAEKAGQSTVNIGKSDTGDESYKPDEI